LLCNAPFISQILPNPSQIDRVIKISIEDKENFDHIIQDWMIDDEENEAIL
jgi:hypothetical protein